MSTPVYTQPSTENLCGEFVEPTTRDPGRAYSAALKPSCEAVVLEADGDSVQVFVNGVATFVQI